MAEGLAFGPAQGLAIVDGLKNEPRLQGSHLLPTVRGDLLEKLGRFTEARTEYRLAAELTGNDKEHALLLSCAGALDSACAVPASRSRSL